MDFKRLSQFTIFEAVPRTERAPGTHSWWSALWSGVKPGKYVPYTFALGVRLTADVVILGIAVIIGATTHAPIITIALIEALFLASGALLLFSRALGRFEQVVGAYLTLICLSLVLNLFFPGFWGNVCLYLLSVILLYRFPPAWSWPLEGVCLLALIVSDGALSVLSDHQPGKLILTLLLSGGLGWFGWTQRSQYLLVVRLHETEEQLREQMARSEALAAEQERTRIARDIHDVLSHSLAVLSIQVQAARQLLARDPARLAAKLDDMAALIRESIAESRRVVGLLREQPPVSNAQDDLRASLSSLATTFSERTGIHCRFEESGSPHTLSPRQCETLQLALREMLTNAHRHGAAQSVWITLRWQDRGLVLATRDDGTGGKVVSKANIAVGDGTNTAGSAAEEGGHHGLQGMRERVTALGGEVEAGPLETGGFAVTLRLPYEPIGEQLLKKEKARE
jgi:signal transduction histidine kinase